MWPLTNSPAYFPPCSYTLGTLAFPIFLKDTKFLPNLESLHILLLLLCSFLPSIAFHFFFFFF